MNELDMYRMAVRRCICENDGMLFPNTCPEKTAIVLQEFIRAAQRRICIFCGHLARDVYEQLLPDLEEAIARKVLVRVICEPGELETQELAAILRDNGSLRQLDANPGIPHFAVFDTLRYRIERQQNSREAIVCAYAEGEEKRRTELIEGVHRKLWISAREA